MSKAAGKVLLVFALALTMCQNAAAVDMTAGYFQAVEKYYNITSEEVLKVSQTGMADEELPVVFFITGRSDVSPSEVTKIRLEGASWSEVCNEFSLSPSDFYVMVSGTVDSRVYGPVFDKYKNTPQKKWSELQFTDAEIIDLINLKLMYSLHDYSVYEIMAMRDYGKSFLKINQQVLLARQEMNEKQNKTLEAR